MCKRRVGDSIFKDCRDAIFKENGGRHITNQEMRRVIEENGGCMMHGVVDKPILHMQELSLAGNARAIRAS